MKILGVLLFFFSLTTGAMEMPPALSVPSSVSQVPSLVELAARKCQKAVEQFDPHKGYLRAVNNLDSRAIHHVLGQKLASLLARSNAQVLQSILDEETEPTIFRASYSSVNQNLYEDGHGIYQYSGSFFNPPLRQAPDTKYRPVTLSEDKAVCITSNQLSLTLWNVVTGNQIKQINYPLAGQNYYDLRAIKFSPDGKLVFARFREDLPDLPNGKPHCIEHMCAFDVTTGQMLYENLNSGWALQIGKRFIYFTKSNQLHAHDLVTNVLRGVLTIDPRLKSPGKQISPDDDYICHVLPQHPNLIKVDGTPGNKIDKSLDCKDEVRAMRLNETGSFLAASTNTMISVWKPRDGACVSLIEHKPTVDTRIISFGNWDTIIYTRANNIICAWDIENKKLLFSKEFPYAGDLKDGIYGVDIIKHDQAALIWKRIGGPKIHALYSILGNQLSLKELSALLVFEYETEHNLPFSPAALEIVQQTQNPLLKQIYEKRYNTVSAAVELVSAAVYECANSAMNRGMIID